MSKKKFTEGLESLFGEEQEEKFLQEEDALLFPPDEVVIKRKGKSGTKAKSKAKKASKTFSEDIEGFLASSFEESFEQQIGAAQQKKSSSTTNKKRSRRPRSGLDLLIRNTVKPSSITLKDGTTRRVTLVFEEEKLEKLKTIARQESVFLKDIINEIVGEYLATYQKKS
ncbi:MAG: hypothetical protein AAF798_23085 [Bacteroidota bacterium]